MSGFGESADQRADLASQLQRTADADESLADAQLSSELSGEECPKQKDKQAHLKSMSKVRLVKVHYTVTSGLEESVPRKTGKQKGK